MEKLVLTGTVCFCVGLTVGLILDESGGIGEQSTEGSAASTA